MLWWENHEVTTTFLGKYNLPLKKNDTPILNPFFMSRSHSIVPEIKAIIL